MMKEEKIKNILRELKTLQEHIQSWNNLPAIPEIEKDSVLRIMQELYVQLKSVTMESETEPIPLVKESMSEIIIDAPPAIAPVKVEETAAMNVEAEKQQRNRAKTFAKQEQPVTLFDTVSDKPQQPEETLLEKLSKRKEEKSLADKFSSLPVGDLKKSIGINERFKFINELFESSTAEYNQFIERLNACTSSDEAFRLMEEEYAARLGWNKEEETYQSLTALIGRKFA
ncbi:MAG: hypothetical protein JNL47_09330 [Bacteroidia bacterium]|nr:hypothetical protein [Bacteroidia bacterium]